MKHVPSGREERKTARELDPSTREDNSQGWDPRTRERRSSANGRQAGKVCVPIGCGLTVQATGEDKSPDDDDDADEVISTLQKSIEVSMERTTKEVVVRNLQMIVERESADDREDREDCCGTPVGVLVSDGGCAVESQ